VLQVASSCPPGTPIAKFLEEHREEIEVEIQTIYSTVNR
jgi:hypothetical protein